MLSLLRTVIHTNLYFHEPGDIVVQVYMYIYLGLASEALRVLDFLFVRCKVHCVCMLHHTFDGWREPSGGTMATGCDSEDDPSVRNVNYTARILVLYIFKTKRKKCDFQIHFHFVDINLIVRTCIISYDKVLELYIF